VPFAKTTAKQMAVRWPIAVILRSILVILSGRSGGGVAPAAILAKINAQQHAAAGGRQA
jgi:hypothetical protein